MHRRTAIIQAACRFVNRPLTQSSSCPVVTETLRDSHQINAEHESINPQFLWLGQCVRRSVLCEVVRVHMYVANVGVPRNPAAVVDFRNRKSVMHTHTSRAHCPAVHQVFHPIIGTYNDGITIFRLEVDMS